MNKWIKEYQCLGCVNYPDNNCYQRDQNYKAIDCTYHCAGTMRTSPTRGLETILLGISIPFARKNDFTFLKIWESFKDFDWGGYDKFNVPVWKYLNENNHTIVKVLMPRINYIYIHIFLENCIDKIDCLELTKDDIAKMD